MWPSSGELISLENIWVEWSQNILCHENKTFGSRHDTVLNTSSNDDEDDYLLLGFLSHKYCSPPASELVKSSSRWLIERERSPCSESDLLTVTACKGGKGGGGGVIKHSCWQCSVRLTTSYEPLSGTFLMQPTPWLYLIFIYIVLTTYEVFEVSLICNVFLSGILPSNSIISYSI